MNTEKLYYIDSHIREFDARVVDCQEKNGRFWVELTRTAFFPEGGGQAGDVGTLNNIEVLDTRSVGDTVLHLTKKPLPVGEKVRGELDWSVRFPRMQSHTAEHIVSGLVHRRFGFDNVGFHMGAEGLIVDFDGFVPSETLREIEAEANEIVWQDRPVTTAFPDPAELPALTYRSKLDLTENVRLVTIEGVDVCACCAPHVHRTGEIGVIKIFESIRRKEGLRLRMLAGQAAYRDYCQKSDSVSRVSALLSAKPEATAEAVERLLAERDRLSYELGGLKRDLIRRKVENIAQNGGPLLFFEPDFTAEDAKLLCEAAQPLTDGLCAVFFGPEGKLRYCITAPDSDLRAVARDMNTALAGRGGGSAGLISGFVAASRQEIENYFKGAAI